MSTPFRLTHDGPVSTLTLSNPEKRNALVREVWEDLPKAIDELSDSGTCRALVIDSEGPHFTAGIDLTMLAGAAPDNLGAAEGLHVYHMVLFLQEAFSCLERARMPVIASIQGGCIGAGVDLITACDIRLCTADAYFTIYEINMGMTADVGTFPRILNHLPEGIVRELAYTGRRMTPEEALRWGLVNSIHDSQEACNKAAQDMAQEIATKAPMAVHGSKEIITYCRDHTTAEGLDRIALWNAANLKSSELMQAMQAKTTGQPGSFASLPEIKHKKA